MQNRPERRQRPSIGARTLVIAALCAAFALLLLDPTLPFAPDGAWRLALSFVLLLTIPLAFRVLAPRAEADRRRPIVWSRLFVGVLAFAAFGVLVTDPIRAAISDRTLRYTVGFAITLLAAMVLVRWIRPQRRTLER